ncbi:MAG: transcription elongation factor GreB [Bdellovibrionales bacterium]
MNEKNYITPHGAERLKQELRQLRDGERPEVVKTVAWAASNGDRSENADYIYGKRRLREIDRRIEFLKTRLEKAHVVDPTLQKGDHILFGATVTVELDNGDTKTFSIVGADEVDVSKGHISWHSPIGKALLNAHKGQSVRVQLPRGEEELEILDVKYVELR